MSGLTPERAAPPLAVSRPTPRWIRIVFMAVALTAWFWTQSLIGRRAFPADEIGDLANLCTAPPQDCLRSHPARRGDCRVRSKYRFDPAGPLHDGRFHRRGHGPVRRSDRRLAGPVL